MKEIIKTSFKLFQSITFIIWQALSIVILCVNRSLVITHHRLDSLRSVTRIYHKIWFLLEEKIWRWKLGWQMRWDILFLLMNLMAIEVSYVAFACEINQVLTLKSLVMRSWLATFFVTIHSFPSFFKVCIIYKVFRVISSFLKIRFVLCLHLKNLKSGSKKIFSIFWIINLLSHFLGWLFHHFCWLIIITFFFIRWSLKHIHAVCGLGTYSNQRRLSLI
jgi:hypothetical protein